MAKTSSASSEINLSASQWLVVLAALVAVPIGGWLLLRFVQGVASLADSATWVVGGVSLAVSAYAALSANKLKALEFERGDRAAHSLLASDAQEALTLVAELRKRAEAIDNRGKDEWRELLSEINQLAQRTERKYDQLAILSTHFTPERFLKVRELYLKISDLWMQPQRFALPEDVADKDLASLLPQRRSDLTTFMTETARSVLGVYQELELPRLPPQITELAAAPRVAAQQAAEADGRGR